MFTYKRVHCILYNIHFYIGNFVVNYYTDNYNILNSEII